MTGYFFVLALLYIVGTAALVAAYRKSRAGLAERIAPFIGNSKQKDYWELSLQFLLNSKLFEHPRSAWGSDRKVTELLRVAGSSETLKSFRIQQLTYIGIGFSAATGWALLKSAAHEPFSTVQLLMLFATAISAAGWFAVWQLENLQRKRSENVDAALPVFLELMAFTVGAGEPLVAAIERVSHEITGDFANEVSAMTTRIHAGESLADALHRLERQFANVSLMRTIRTLDTAVERGTPLAEVLRAQASDARAAYARSLLVLAGKKETAMLLPVVFLILPMIVAVAIYPGLIALNVM